MLLLLGGHDSAEMPLEVSLSLKVDGMDQLTAISLEEVIFLHTLAIIPVLCSELDNISRIVHLHLGRIRPHRIAYAI